MRPATTGARPWAACAFAAVSAALIVPPAYSSAGATGPRMTQHNTIPAAYARHSDALNTAVTDGNGAFLVYQERRLLRADARRPAPRPHHKPKPVPSQAPVIAVTASAQPAAAQPASAAPSPSSTPAPSSPPPIAVSGTPQEYAQSILAQYGWDGSQMNCLVPLWDNESGWNYQASNPTSGAYGIPQALPGSKMASAGADWQTDPDTQIRWGLGYIQASYGSPCGAWSHEQADGWY
jgi:hypothetical protein